MFTKPEQRLIKEMLIQIYRNMPETLHYSVYFVPLGLSNSYRDMREMANLVNGMQSLEQIPWPDENCIIISQDIFSRLIDIDTPHLIAIIRSKKIFDRYALFPKSENRGTTEALMLVAGYLVNNNFRTYHKQICLTHITNGKDKWVPNTFENSLRRHLGEIIKAIESAGYSIPPDTVKKLEDWMRFTNPYGLDEFWECLAVSESKTTPEMGLVADIFACLANIVVPCHYFVRSKFTEGFGTSSIRRITRDKPILTIINFDRLYHLCKQHGYDEVEIKPHFRRGHIRHFWKEAGIDRFCLPPQAIDRIRLVAQHNVRRTYIPPTWVGKTHFDVDNISHDIVVEEVVLPQVRK